MTSLEKVQAFAREQAETYSVMVDGNRHREITARIRTAKEMITVAKCRQIVSGVEARFGVEIERIEICMSEWNYGVIQTESDAELVLWGDYPLTDASRRKHAIYLPKSNTLQIWQNGLPIYENANGRICRDATALADCLC